jgi:hypothetical protein
VARVHDDPVEIVGVPRHRRVTEADIAEIGLLVPFAFLHGHDEAIGGSLGILLGQPEGGRGGPRVRDAGLLQQHGQFGFP